MGSLQTPTGATPRTVGGVTWLGTDINYLEAWETQKRIAVERANGTTQDTLLLLEHSPVYTAGPRALREHVIGILDAPLVNTDRGGQITYHGPGQLVGYPIVGLTSKGLGPKAYVRALEASLVDALGELGVVAHTEDGLTGVWTARGKIAAIGIRITRGVAMHGFALNVTTDLASYAPIIPCGIGDRPVTSVAEVLAEAVPDDEVVRRTVVVSLGVHLAIDWTIEG